MSDLGIYFYSWIGSSDDVPEGETNLYLTEENLLEFLALLSIDVFADVDTSSVAAEEGDILKVDETGLFRQGKLSLSELADVVFSTDAVDGDALVKEGLVWKQGKPSLETWTTSTLPEPNTRVNKLVFCTDSATGSPLLGFSDGLDWKLMPFADCIDDDAPPPSGLDWRVVTPASWAAWQTYLLNIIARNSNFNPKYYLTDAVFSNGQLGGFGCGVAASNGKIYGIPASREQIMKFDCLSHQVSFFPQPYSPYSIVRWISGVLAHDEKIYCMPFVENNLLIINTNTDTASLLPVPFVVNMIGRWFGTVLGPNGYVYGIPFHEGRVSIFDPTNNSFTFVEHGLGYGGALWGAGVLAPNGCIYGVPMVSNKILKIDTTNNSVVCFGSLNGSGEKWVGGILAPNGKIYCPPLQATQILVIDPTNDSYYFLGPVSGIGSFYGGTLGLNGKIYCFPGGGYIPSSNDPHYTLLVIDPSNDTFSYAGNARGGGITMAISLNTGYHSGILGVDGNIYGIPYNTSRILKIDFTGAVNFDFPVHLSGWFNKL